MPYSVDGIGTGLVKASRVREVDGCTQYDAIEAFMFCFIPLIPYKAIHVLAIWDSGYQSEKYQSIVLKPSSHLVTKGMLNGWGNVLSIFGGSLFVFLCFATLTMSRPTNMKDYLTLGGLLITCLIGLTCKTAWYYLNEPDERIKDLLGAHAFGTSDPIHWPDEIARSVIKNLMTEANGLPLTSIAQQAMIERKTSKAMLCVRLAMRGGQNPVAQKLFDQLMASM